MLLKEEKVKILYKAYLIECLSNDIDNKIDYLPISYKKFKKRLKKMAKNDILE